MILYSLLSFIALSSSTTDAWTGGSSSRQNQHVLSSTTIASPAAMRSSSAAAAAAMTMYFDDVSRYGTDPWEPSSETTGPKPKQQHIAKQQQPKEEEQEAMIQRLLTGYDAVAASQLSRQEIQKQTQLWTQKSGVVGNFFGDELFTDLLSINVVRSSDNDHHDDGPFPPGTSARTTSLVHSIAEFWKAVAAVIELHTDKGVWPARWTPHARYENLNLTAATAYASAPCDDDVRGDRVHMLVLPDCPDLYEYTTFTTLLAAVEFSKELCLHLGRHFTLTAFHPHFKDSPTLMSPERHAPFPTIGLQFPRRGGNALIMGHDADLPHHAQTQQYRKPLEQSKTDDNGKILPHPDGTHEDEEIGALADARIRNLDETRNSLEVLFNSAAATTAKNTKEGSSIHFPASSSSGQPATATQSTATASLESDETQDKETSNEVSSVSEEEQLARTFRQERQRRRGDFSPAMVRQVVALWMDEQRYVDVTKREVNPALEFMDTLEGYTVCTQKVGELVYAEIWQAIREVYERGMLADAQLPPPAPKVPEKNKAHFDLSNWMSSLSNDQDPKAAGKKKSDDLPPVTSSLFIATKFNKYNAQAFKRFAITINAALKRITKGRMFLEVFHPEYVGNKGYNHALRRSPFPVIQICYLVQQQPQDPAP